MFPSSWGLVSRRYFTIYWIFFSLRIQPAASYRTALTISLGGLDQSCPMWSGCIRRLTTEWLIRHFNQNPRFCCNGTRPVCEVGRHVFPCLFSYLVMTSYRATRSPYPYSYKARINTGKLSVPLSITLPLFSNSLFSNSLSEDKGKSQAY